MVGGPHAVLDRATQPLGQLVADVADLVLLASADDRVVEHVGIARRSALAPSMTHRIGRVVSRPRSRKPTSSSRAKVVFSVEPSTRASGCLVPSRAMPKATTQVCSAKWTPSTSRQTRSRLGQIRGQQLGQGGVGHGENRRDTADFESPGGLFDLGADRLEPDRAAARRQPAQHPLQREPAQQLGAREQLVGGHRQLPGAVGGPDPGPLDGHAPATKGHRALLVAVPHGAPVRVVLALGAGQRGDRLLHQRPHHLQPGAHGQRQQPFGGRLGDLGQGDGDLVWHGQRRPCSR